MTNNLIPMLGVVTAIRTDTPDIKTFRVEKVGGGKCFEHQPGQCAMLSIPGVSEAMFSITSSPTVKDYQEFSIKKCGCLSGWLHMMDVGQEITIRGPYGRPFPVDTELKGKDLLFIAGGVGLAPLHSVINYCLAHRENYGKIDVVYGSRSMEDLLDLPEIQNEWMRTENNLNVHLTIDRPQLASRSTKDGLRKLHNLLPSLAGGSENRHRHRKGGADANRREYATRAYHD